MAGKIGAKAGRVMGVVALAGCLYLGSFAFGDPPESGIEVVAIVGASGEEEYGGRFTAAEAQWRKRCEEAGAGYCAIGLGENEGGVSDLERLGRDLAARIARETGELWIVLIGHGTFDGRNANFNLRGPDLSATQLRDWLAPSPRGLVVINTASSSGPFVSALSGPGRVVITATRSGDEMYHPEFGERFAGALAAKDADLDEDGQTSLLESFLKAARAVAASYEERGLLATEHALLDDNGDRKGTRADWFHGVRVLRRAEGEAEPDGMRAHQKHLIPSVSEREMPPDLRRRRDEIEIEINRWRLRMAELEEGEYYGRLEQLLLQIAEIYRRAEAPGPSAPDGPGS